MSQRNRNVILLVEDEALLALTEKRQLEKYGYEVRTVTTGEKAIEAVRTSSEIDLILMDINLGAGIDGTQAAEIILKSRDLPVVFLSSHTDPEVVEKTEKITSYGYVVKNSSITVLDASIKMAFRLFDANQRLRNELVARREAEERIREMDVRMRKLFTNVPELIYQFTRRPDGSYYVPIASDGVRNIFGCNPEDVLDSFEPISRVIYPEDAARVSQEIEYSAEHLTYFTCEFRVHIPGRDIQWVLSRSTPEKLPDGSITWYGFNADITDRKRAEEAIKEQRDFSESLIETAHAIILVLDTHGRIVQFNPYTEELLGYRLDEVKGMDWIETFTSPQIGASVKSVFQKTVHDNQTWANVNPIVARDGRTILVEWYNTTLQDADGHTIGILATGNDITERRHSERELITQKQYQTLVQGSPDIIYLFGSKSGGIFWSEATSRILGTTPQDIVRDPFLWNRSIHPEDRPMVERAIAGAIEGEPFDIEYRIQAKDGRWVWLHDKQINRTEEGGEFIIQGYAQDITEQKNRKDALEKERHRLAAILDGTNVGTWEWNVQTGETRFNERWAMMIGYTLEEISPVSIETWKRFADPEDLKRSEEALRAHFAGETDYYESEARMRHRDGRWIWLLDRGKVATWTADGEPEWIFGTHQDINARKRQEEKRLALANAASTLQGFSAESIDYAGIAETAKQLSGAAFVVLNTFGLRQQIFTTRAIAGLSEHIQNASKLLGFPVVGRTWNFDPQREAALGDRRTTVFSSLGSLASGSFSASIANRVARMFHIGEVVIVRIATATDIQGDFALFYSDRDHLQDRDLVETYSSMVGITLERIRTDQQNTKLVADKEALLREVHHRIKNNMNTMTSLLSLHANSVTDATAASAIKDAESRMRSMQTLYDQLNLSADQSRSSVASYLSTLVPQVVNLFPAGNAVRVSVASSAADCNTVPNDRLSSAQTHECTVDAKRLSTVGLIVNELVTNSMKYAFPTMASSEAAGTAAPVISVAVDCADGEISIIVEDNGVGLPPSFDREKSSGFGMMILNAMTGQLDGTLTYESGHSKASRGTRAVLRFPSNERG